MNHSPRRVGFELLVDARARLGECALWCDLRQTLYWTDIEAATLHGWSQDDGRTRHWTLPERLGSFALTGQASQLLLGLASGVALFNLDTQQLSPIIPVEAENPSTRINDGRCDAQGRFVFGMFNQASVEAAIGRFYRVTPDLAVERLPLPPVAVANSIAFSPDGTRIYLADSPTRAIYCADYHADGRIGALRLFTRLSTYEGYPDGSTVDSDGGLWNAQWDGGCVVRYDVDGIETDRIVVPSSRPTSPAFFGLKRDRMALTTAHIGLSDAARRDQPSAGGVFVCTPGRLGVPEHRFVTPLRA